MVMADAFNDEKKKSLIEKLENYSKGNKNNLLR